MLGDELALVAIEHFGISEAGNFEGTSIPVRATPDPEGLAEIKARLLAAREQRVRPGLDDKRLTSWNALMISALAEAGAVLGRDDYRDAARRLRGVRPARPPRRPRAPAAHLQPRPRQARGLPGGPRVPARGAADALRGDVRRALVRRGARARRAAARALRRPRARRLLRRRRRPRAADRAPQGARGRADPVGRERRGVRAAAARRADRRGALRGRGAGRDPPAAHARAAARDRVRAPAAGDRLPPRPRSRRSRSSATTSRRSSASCASASARTSCWPAARRTACRCWPGARRSTAAPRPTCASASPASAR